MCEGLNAVEAHNDEQTEIMELDNDSSNGSTEFEMSTSVQPYHQQSVQTNNVCEIPVNWHISRDNVVEHHTTAFARQLMANGDPDTANLVADETYIYIQVSNNDASMMKDILMNNTEKILDWIFEVKGNDLFKDMYH
ncbi:unnamed protein product [Didymodactylos carnosus]|uniref:Uncharacterized protein n=1 Tax=Didymodactylos carnosus TaxID=1234261 RepID=A0A814XM46_9BILA|nr:unnamed protein product [Didymodactylos carnosus]CAF1399411.1 unnamed protein product [Didymodactylos carnosus]CAF3979857.1 unnamed protein product [Didymodactylos carnosus]CAF4206724.1 unnamed protein product [Didymodactylos carnosus]